MNDNQYKPSQTLEQWEETISSKFNDIPLRDRAKDVSKILSIDDKNEIQKIDKASLIVYGKSTSILSFEDACTKLDIIDAYNNISILNSLPLINRNKFIAEYKLQIIVRAVNDDWLPNWNNSNEIKYHPYFDRVDGFYFWDIFAENLTSRIPAHLTFKSIELAYFVGNYFIDLYRDYYK